MTLIKIKKKQQTLSLLMMKMLQTKLIWTKKCLR